MSRDETIVLSDKERDAVRRLAERFGQSEENIIEILLKHAIARRVRRRTGKGPARVYGMPKRS